MKTRNTGISRHILVETLENNTPQKNAKILLDIINVSSNSWKATAHF